ncbi:MAG: hypothetical protein WDA16_15180 [Candidatus Thermoplasmatota archaeon]
MNGIQTTGILLAIIGSIFALGSAAMGTVSMGGSAGYGGPGGYMTVGSGNLSWISLGVAAVGVMLVVVGREK